MSKFFRIVFLLLGLVLVSATTMVNRASLSDQSFGMKAPMADSIIAYVYQATTQNPGLSCSTESTGIPVTGLKIKIRTLDNGLVLDSAFTDNTGRFALEAPLPGTLISLEPCVIGYPDPPTNPGQNGLTVYDVNSVQYHVDKDTIYACPALRVAADFTFDGRIDINDVLLLDDYVRSGANRNYPYNPWRLLPNILNYQTNIHPDPSFTAQYWTMTYPERFDYSDPYYPFDASLHLFGEEIQYRGDHHWRDTVKKWQYTPSINNCGVANYGFWLVKAGDMNGTISPDFPSGCIGNMGGMGNFQSNGSEDQQKELNGEAAVLKTNTIFGGTSSPQNGDSYVLSVRINAQAPIEAYQLGLRIDTSWLVVDQIEAISELGQTVARNYNARGEDLDKGFLRTLWLDSEESNGPVPSNQWQQIMQIKLILQKTAQNPQDLKDAVKLDADVLKAEFISAYEILDRSLVDVQLELSPE